MKADKRTLLGIVCAVALVVVFLGRHRLFGYAWGTFHSHDDRFSVQLPGDMRSGENWVRSKPDSWVVYQCVFYDDKGYGGRQTLAPGEAFTEKLMDSYSSSVLTKYRGVIESQLWTSVQDLPARDTEARLVNAPNSYLDFRIIRTKERLYFLMVETFNHKRDPENIRRFYASFKILRDAPTVDP